MSEYRCIDWGSGGGEYDFISVQNCIDECSNFSDAVAWAGSGGVQAPPNLRCWCLTDAQVKSANADQGCKPCPDSQDAAAGRLCGDPMSSTTMAVYAIPGRILKQPNPVTQQPPPNPSQNPNQNPNQGPVQSPTTQSPPPPESSSAPSISSPPSSSSTVDPASLTSTTSPLTSSSTEIKPSSILTTINSSNNGTEPTQTSTSIDTPPASNGNGPVMIIGIVAALLVIVAAAIAILVWRRIKRSKEELAAKDRELYKERDGPMSQQQPNAWIANHARSSPIQPQGPFYHSIPPTPVSVFTPPLSTNDHKMDTKQSELWHTQPTYISPSPPDQKFEFPPPNQSYINPAHQAKFEEANNAGGVKLPFEQRDSRGVDVTMTMMMKKNEYDEGVGVGSGASCGGADVQRTTTVGLPEYSEH
ncbi:hypothetical protein HDU97_001470 [Phlyctochytrium planicorne]|nr:hypothetical protein HDU97_001470 [Phlyctochytrium planicorne]